MTAIVDDRIVGSPVVDESDSPDLGDDAYWALLSEEAEERWGNAASETEAKSTLPNLPEEFWSARERFAQIRQAAWHIGCGADVAFLTVLCRTSAMVSPQLNFDLGRGVGSLNMFGGAIGGSGAGKSQSVEVGQELLLPATYLLDEEGEIDDDKFRDGVPLGTGEGIAEAYMGWKNRPTGEVDGKGRPKMEKVRAQVRHHVFYYLDEGETLSKMMMERQGTTIGQAIRTAWVGGTLGQTNAREETTRLVRRRHYALGMVIGYQPETVQALLADGAAGTPQRFLWMSAIDPKLPAVRPDRPRKFSLPICNGVGEAITGTIDGPDWIAKELWDRRVNVVRGEEVVDRLNSHVDLMRCKLAALLAVIDNRLTVNKEDWQLSEVIWNASCAVRDRLTEVGKRAARDRQEQETARYVEREERVQITRHSVEASVQRIARWVGKRIHEKGPGTRGDTKRAMSSEDRKYFDAATDFAMAQGWVLVEDRLLIAGSARPV